MLLIQIISKDCVPDLVAARTFQPSHIIWIYPPQLEHVFHRMQDITRNITDRQTGWCVDGGDVQAMNHELMQRFWTLPSDINKLVCHFSSGSRAVALQCMANLGVFHRKTSIDAEAVVLDTRSQSFDIVYPLAKDDVYTCTTVNLADMLAAHGNYLDANRPMRDLDQCHSQSGFSDQMRQLAPDVKKAMHGKYLKALHAQESKRRHVRLQSRTNGHAQSLPGVLVRAFQIVRDMGLIEDLRQNGNSELTYVQRGCMDAFAFINGGWLEDWLGAVMSELKWDGAGSGVYVLMGHRYASQGSDSQEFDFLGARGNHLVYWSCKHTTKLTHEQLFEVDALRDEISGDGNHIVGILHAGEIKQGLLAKAKRLNVHVVNAWADDARERILELCR